MAGKPVERVIFYCGYDVNEEHYKEPWRIEDPSLINSVSVKRRGRTFFKRYQSELDDFFDGKPILAYGSIDRAGGAHESGKLINSISELIPFSYDLDCDFIRLSDYNGHLFVRGLRRNLRIDVEVKELTEDGERFIADNPSMDREELYKKLFRCSRYSLLPNYAHEQYGAPKKQYKPYAKTSRKRAFA